MSLGGNSGADAGISVVHCRYEIDSSIIQNPGIAISEEGVADLKKVGDVSVPEEYYLGKKIRVVGEVVIEDDRVYIKVSHAEQLNLAKVKTSPLFHSPSFRNSVTPYGFKTGSDSLRASKV